jgi:hypothetical protein
MKQCSIMQPTYLPWAGYFNLVAKADIFVFLDDAQLQKNSWHNRNRLLVNHVPHWITVPVKRNFLAQSIKETEIDSTQNWRVKQSKLLQQTYSKHPFAKDALSICSVIERSTIEHLAELNIFLIRWVLDQLDIETEILLSSELGVEGKRTDRLIELLHKLHVDCYVSPKGAMDYLEEDGFRSQTEIKLLYQDFNPAPYKQHRHADFESHLSIVDVVANLGWGGAKKYVS